MGHDDNSPTGLTGTTGALPAWSKLMSSIQTTSFEPLMPETLEDRWIDYFSGRETSPYCDGSAVSCRSRRARRSRRATCARRARRARSRRIRPPRSRKRPPRRWILRQRLDLPSPGPDNRRPCALSPVRPAFAALTGGCAIEPFQKTTASPASAGTTQAEPGRERTRPDARRRSRGAHPKPSRASRRRHRRRRRANEPRPRLPR